MPRRTTACRRSRCEKPAADGSGPRSGQRMGRSSSAVQDTPGSRTLSREHARGGSGSGPVVSHWICWAPDVHDPCGRTVNRSETPWHRSCSCVMLERDLMAGTFSTQQEVVQCPVRCEPSSPCPLPALSSTRTFRWAGLSRGSASTVFIASPAPFDDRRVECGTATNTGRRCGVRHASSVFAPSALETGYPGRTRVPQEATSRPERLKRLPGRRSS